MFNPKTYDECCAAMKTGAMVDIDGTIGIIISIRRDDFTEDSKVLTKRIGRGWIVEIANATDNAEVITSKHFYDK